MRFHTKRLAVGCAAVLLLITACNSTAEDGPCMLDVRLPDLFAGVEAVIIGDAGDQIGVWQESDGFEWPIHEIEVSEVLYHAGDLAPHPLAVVEPGDIVPVVADEADVSLRGEAVFFLKGIDRGRYPERDADWSVGLSAVDRPEGLAFSTNGGCIDAQAAFDRLVQQVEEQSYELPEALATGGSIGLDVSVALVDELVRLGPGGDPAPDSLVAMARR